MEYAWQKRLSDLAAEFCTIIGPNAAMMTSIMVKIFFQQNSRKSKFWFLAEYFKNLDEMLPLCDFVCIVCSLTDETKDLLTYKHFELMKKSAIFCNISRGDTVKQDDLVKVSLRFNA